MPPRGAARAHRRARRRRLPHSARPVGRRGGSNPLPVGRAEARAPPRAAGMAAGRRRPARRMGRPVVPRSRRSRPARVANGHAGAELSVSWRPNYGAQPVSGGSPTFALQPRCPDYGAQPVSAWDGACRGPGAGGPERHAGGLSRRRHACRMRKPMGCVCVLKK